MQKSLDCYLPRDMKNIFLNLWKTIENMIVFHVYLYLLHIIIGESQFYKQIVTLMREKNDWNSKNRQFKDKSFLLIL